MSSTLYFEAYWQSDPIEIMPIKPSTTHYFELPLGVLIPAFVEGVKVVSVNGLFPDPVTGALILNPSDIGEHGTAPLDVDLKVPLINLPDIVVGDSTILFVQTPNW